PELQANVVVLAGAPDAASRSSFDEVAEAAVAAKEIVHTLGLGPASTVGGASLQVLADRTGGEYLETSGVTGAATLMAKASHLIANQFVVKYSSASKGGTLDIAVTNGAGVPAHASIGPGTVGSGTALNPDVVVPEKPLPIIG